MSVHVSISPERPVLTTDGQYWFLRIAPDALIVMTDEQAQTLSELLWNRAIPKSEAA